MVTDEDRRRIMVEATARVGAEFWQTIAAALTALEGRGWHGGIDPELFQLSDGRLAWRVGRRQFLIESEHVVETLVDENGLPVRRRVIEQGGQVIEDELLG